jgi:anti-sigma factor RsiW
VNKSELFDLIPLYVSGKLSDEQKTAIEHEMSRSKELQEEVAFWRAGQAATRDEANYRGAAHLTSEQIVDFARGSILDPLTKREVERHLQACTLCNDDLATIRPSFIKSAPTALQRLIQQITMFVMSLRELLTGERGETRPAILRPAYALPLVAILVVSSIMIYRLTIPVMAPVSFALQFQTQERSTNGSTLQTLSLPRSTGAVHAAIPIPHASLLPRMVDVVLTLSTPSKKSTQLTESLAWSVGSTFDTARVDIHGLALREPGVYSLRAAIKYTPDSEPFEFSYQFRVVPEE